MDTSSSSEDESLSLVRSSMSIPLVKREQAWHQLPHPSSAAASLSVDGAHDGGKFRSLKQYSVHAVIVSETMVGFECHP